MFLVNGEAEMKQRRRNQEINTAGTTQNIHKKEEEKTI